MKNKLSSFRSYIYSESVACFISGMGHWFGFISKSSDYGAIAIHDTSSVVGAASKFGRSPANSHNRKISQCLMDYSCSIDYGILF
jgi:hypothetical protein